MKLLTTMIVSASLVTLVRVHAEESFLIREYLVDFKHLLASVPQKEDAVKTFDMQEWATQHGVEFPPGACFRHGYRDSQIGMWNTARNHDRLLCALRRCRAFIGFPRARVMHSNIQNLDVRATVHQ